VNADEVAALRATAEDLWQAIHESVQVSSYARGMIGDGRAAVQRWLDAPDVKVKGVFFRDLDPEAARAFADADARWRAAEKALRAEEAEERATAQREEVALKEARAKERAAKSSARRGTVPSVPINWRKK
jgi:hypothetical protein